MPFFQALAGVACIGALAFLAILLPSAWRIWRIYAGAPTRRLTDAGPEVIPPPPDVAERLEELRDLGFHRIGERWAALPGVPIYYEWVVGDTSGATNIGLVTVLGVGALLECNTVWDDGMWIQTAFPRGVVLERPSLSVTFVTSTVARAVATHRERVERLRPSHGTPRAVLTMADSLRMDGELRSRFGNATLRPLLVPALWPALLAAMLVVGFGLLFVLLGH